jgi:hypothetical protein
MDQNIATDVSAGATFLCAKSWIAYLWLVLVAAMLMVALPFVYQWNMWAAIAMMAVGWTFIGYNALHTYSQRLYCDHLGVWLQIGFLPWPGPPGFPRRRLRLPTRRSAATRA